VHGAEDRRCGDMSGRVHKKHGPRSTPASADSPGARRGGVRGAVAPGRGGLPLHLDAYAAAAISEAASAKQSDATGALSRMPLRRGLTMGGGKKSGLTSWQEEGTTKLHGQPAAPQAAPRQEETEADAATALHDQKHLEADAAIKHNDQAHHGPSHEENVQHANYTKQSQEFQSDNIQLLIDRLSAEKARLEPVQKDDSDPLDNAYGPPPLATSSPARSTSQHNPHGTTGQNIWPKDLLPNKGGEPQMQMSRPTGSTPAADGHRALGKGGEESGRYTIKLISAAESGAPLRLLTPATQVKTPQVAEASDNSRMPQVKDTWNDAAPRATDSPAAGLEHRAGYGSKRVSPTDIGSTAATQTGQAQAATANKTHTAADAPTTAVTPKCEVPKRAETPTKPTRHGRLLSEMQTRQDKRIALQATVLDWAEWTVRRRSKKRVKTTQAIWKTNMQSVATLRAYAEQGILLRKQAAKVWRQRIWTFTKPVYFFSGHYQGPFTRHAPRECADLLTSFEAWLFVLRMDQVTPATPKQGVLRVFLAHWVGSRELVQIRCAAEVLAPLVKHGAALLRRWRLREALRIGRRRLALKLISRRARTNCAFWRMTEAFNDWRLVANTPSGQMATTAPDLASPRGFPNAGLPATTQPEPPDTEHTPGKLDTSTAPVQDTGDVAAVHGMHQNLDGPLTGHRGLLACVGLVFINQRSS